MLDRIAPTKRPNDKIVGYQSWKELLFVHWPIPIAALRPLIPERLTIDTYEDVAYIGVVPFAMEGVKPWWIPSWMAFTFLETNLRTYVHLDGKDPGVYFFSLEAASWLAVQAARIGWGLPYFYAKMESQRKAKTITYQTHRIQPNHAKLTAKYDIGKILGPSTPGTLEHFLFERYLLYAQKGGTLWKGQVHHPPYPVQLAHLHNFEEDLIKTAGLPAPTTPPPLTHFSEGVDVEVFPLKPIGK